MIAAFAYAGLAEADGLILSILWRYIFHRWAGRRTRVDPERLKDTLLAKVVDDEAVTENP
jgi:hypothetical protein